MRPFDVPSLVPVLRRRSVTNYLTGKKKRKRGKRGRMRVVSVRRRLLMSLLLLLLLHQRSTSALIHPRGGRGGGGGGFDWWCMEPLSPTTIHALQPQPTQLRLTAGAEYPWEKLRIKALFILHKIKRGMEEDGGRDSVNGERERERRSGGGGGGRGREERVDERVNFSKLEGTPEDTS